MQGPRDQPTDEPHYEWELYLPGQGYETPGFLTLIKRGVRIDTVELPGRVNRILVAAYLARHCDDALGLGGPPGGWRSSIQLNGIISRELGHDYRVEPATVSKYASMLLRLASQFKTTLGGHTPPLLERRRHLGYRLAENAHLIIRRSSNVTTSTDAPRGNVTPPIRRSISDAALMDAKQEGERTGTIPQSEANPPLVQRCRR